MAPACSHDPWLKVYRLPNYLKLSVGQCNIRLVLHICRFQCEYAAVCSTICMVLQHLTQQRCQYVIAESLSAKWNVFCRLQHIVSKNAFIYTYDFTEAWLKGNCSTQGPRRVFESGVAKTFFEPRSGEKYFLGPSRRV